jgi:sterol desaturase/sphingolipid hydroxylase (fatty acid hydroxylase superfamily)
MAVIPVAMVVVIPVAMVVVIPVAMAVAIPAAMAAVIPAAMAAAIPVATVVAILVAHTAHRLQHRQLVSKALHKGGPDTGMCSGSLLNRAQKYIRKS